MEAVAAAAGGGVVEGLAELVAAEEPAEGAVGLQQPEALPGLFERGEAGADGGFGLDGLLIEAGALAIAGVEAFGADGAEEARIVGLLREQPAQRVEAEAGDGVVLEVGAGDDEGVGQLGVGVGEHGLEPGPALLRHVADAVVVGLGAVQQQQAVDEAAAGVGGDADAALAAVVLVQAQQREGPGTRGGAGAGRVDGTGAGAVDGLEAVRGVGVEQARQRALEALRGPGLQARVVAAADAGAQRPEHAALAVGRAGVLEPVAVEGHEVAEAAGVVVPGVVEEGGVGQRELAAAVDGFAVEVFDDAGGDERAGVVVDAVALAESGEGEGGVLEDAGAVGEPVQVVQPELRELGRAGDGADRGRTRAGLTVAAGRGLARPGLDARGAEDVDVLRGDLAPDGLAAVEVGAFADGVAAPVVVEQAVDRGGDRVGVPKGHEFAAAVGQQLLGVPVRRGHHGFAAAVGVGQRAGGDLRLVEVRRDVDVAGGDELGELVELDEAVEEADVVVDAELGHTLLELEAVGVAVAAQQARVRGAEDDVDRVGVPLDDLRHGLDGVLKPLAGRQQPEGEQDLAPLDAVLVLVERGIDEGDVRDAVGDDADLLVGDVVDLAEHAVPAAGHGDQRLGELDQLIEDGALVVVGLGEDGVQRRDHRQADLAEEGQQVRSGAAAEDAELVLDRDGLDVLEAQEFGGLPVVGEVRLAELKGDVIRIGVAAGPVGDSDGVAVDLGERVGDGAAEVVGEGGDAALARRVGAEEGEAVQADVLADGGAGHVAHGQPRVGGGGGGGRVGRGGAQGGFRAGG